MTKPIKTTKKATRKPKLPMAAPEPTVIDVAPTCECCGEPAGEGNALCPACVASRSVPVAPTDTAQPAPTVTVPMMRGTGKSARTLIRWLKDQRRRGGVLTEEQEADIVAMARAAWHEAVEALDGQAAIAS